MPVTLKPLDSPELFELAAGWLSEEDNTRWLDLGNGQRPLTPAALKIMTQRDVHLLRVFLAEEDQTPIGLAGLSEINRQFKTACVWVVVGNRAYRGRHYGTLATAAMLTVAFRDLGLHAVNTWVVDGSPSVRIVERLNFRFIGRQRRCHDMDGYPYDRLLFDILASEHPPR